MVGLDCLPQSIAVVDTLYTDTAMVSEATTYEISGLVFMQSSQSLYILCSCKGLQDYLPEVFNPFMNGLCVF